MPHMCTNSGRLYATGPLMRSSPTPGFQSCYATRWEPNEQLTFQLTFPPRAPITVSSATTLSSVLEDPLFMQSGASPGDHAKFKAPREKLQDAVLGADTKRLQLFLIVTQDSLDDLPLLLGLGVAIAPNQRHSSRHYETTADL